MQKLMAPFCVILNVFIIFFFFFFFFENYLLVRNRPVIQVGQQGRRRFEGADSNLERLDHQVALIAQSVVHRSTSLRVVGSLLPTQVNKIFQSFHDGMSLCVEKFFVGYL